MGILGDIGRAIMDGISQEADKARARNGAYSEARDMSDAELEWATGGKQFNPSNFNSSNLNDQKMMGFQKELNRRKYEK